MNAGNARKLAGKEPLVDSTLKVIYEKVKQAAENKKLSIDFECPDYLTLCQVSHSLRTLQYQIVQNDDSLVIGIHW